MLRGNYNGTAMNSGKQQQTISTARTSRGWDMVLQFWKWNCFVESICFTSSNFLFILFYFCSSLLLWTNFFKDLEGIKMFQDMAARSDSVTIYQVSSFRATKSKNQNLINFHFPQDTGCLTKSIFQYVDYQFL